MNSVRLLVRPRRLILGSNIFSVPTKGFKHKKNCPTLTQCDHVNYYLYLSQDDRSWMNNFNCTRQVNSYAPYNPGISLDEENQLRNSGRVVWGAVILNGVNFLAKTFTWIYTGSHSMFAESVHSLADTANQLILAVGIRKSLQSPTADHPYGYHPMRYIAPLISGVGIFCVGCGLSIYHGLEALTVHKPEVFVSPMWAYGILTFSLISESTTLIMAIKALNEGAKRSNVRVRDYIAQNRDPGVIVVLLEDVAAVLGIGIAASCMALTNHFETHVFDACGSLMIGSLLGAVASFIIKKNTVALVGKSIERDTLNKINKIIEKDVLIRAIHDVKATDLGNGVIRYKAEVDVDGRELTKKYLEKVKLGQLLDEIKDIKTEKDVELFVLTHGEGVVDLLGAEVDRIEKELRRNHPKVKHVDLEASPDRVFDCYCEVTCKARDPNGNVTFEPWIKRRFPDSYKVKEVLKSIPKFAYPCENLPINNITQFTFVLTNIDSKWTFGYCRISPTTDTRIVLLSQLPWHETFNNIVNHIGSIYDIPDKQDELFLFLKSLYLYKIPDDLNESRQIVLKFPLQNQTRKYSYELPDDSLASIPKDKNLTELYNAINVDNMIELFASALNERHILVTSKRLDRLSACVQALNTLLYPLNWQHIFIPVLPSDLLAYLQAPMPFLIGVPEPTYKKLKLNELGEVVILLADDNIVQTPFEDSKNLPPGIVSSIKADLKSQVALGDHVSRAFLRALVKMIGGYREALEFNNGEKITFNHGKFVATRPTTFQAYLKKMLELQMFRQFIEGRLEMLNAGQGFNDDFEFEVNLYEERSANRVNIQYQDWLNAMKTKGGFILKSINPSLRLMYQGLRDKSKQAYKDWKVKSESQSNSQAPSFFYSRLD